MQKYFPILSKVKTIFPVQCIEVVNGDPAQSVLNIQLLYREIRRNLKACLLLYSH